MSGAKTPGRARFLVGAALGEGSGGVVYRAEDRHTGAIVALKTLRAMTADQVVLLKNEFRALQDLQHANLVQMGELVEEDGQLSLSMEYVEGTDFVTYVTETVTGTFDEPRLRASLRQLASALGALHRADIVHRDIKPPNVPVTSSGRVVVLDFGIALRGGAGRPHDDGGIMGSTLFMAPEQATGEAAGPAADWYAVGVMLFRALTGRHPFEGAPHEVLELKVMKEPPSPRDFAEDLPHDLVALCERLLATDPSERPLHEDVVRALGALSVPPEREEQATLLGRTRELAWIDEAFDAMKRGEPVAAVIYGESGVGKSLLLRTFVERIERTPPPPLCLFSRCYERSSVPFKAFDGATDGLVAALGGMSDEELRPWLSEHAGILPRLFPELGLVPTLAELAQVAVVPHAKDARRHAFEALRFLLSGLASNRPLLLVIDDLQWADADSLSLLRALLAPPNAPPILLLATLRVGADALEKGQRIIDEITRSARSLVLEKLSLDEARLFVADERRRQGAVPLAPDATDALVRETGGNPMFLMDVLHQRNDGSEGSHKIADIVAARVHQLPRAALRLLQGVCVAGLPVEQRTVATAAEVHGADLLGALPQLRTARLIQTWGSGGSVSLEPYHDRLRDIVVNSLSLAERREWHGKLAVALEGSGAEAEPEVLASHWLESNDRPRALNYVLRAADKANAAFAFDRAARFFAQALELSSDPKQQAALRLSLADALTNAGRGPLAANACLAAARDASEADALDLRRRAAEQFLSSGHLKEGRATLNEVLSHFDLRLAPTTLQAIVLLLLIRLWTRIRGLALAKRAPSDVTAHELQRVDACWSAASCLGVVDNVRGAEFAARYLLLALRAGDPARYHRALLVESCFLGGQGARREARRMLEMVRPEAESGRAPYLTAAFELAAGWQAYFNGEFRTGRTRCLRSREMFEEQGVGARWERDTGVYWGLCSQVFLGELRPLANVLPSYLQDAEDRGDLFFETILRIGHVSIHWLANDEADAALSATHSILARWPNDHYLVQHMYGLLTITMIDLYTGGGAKSVQLYEEQWAALNRGMHLRVQLSRMRALQMRASAHLGAAEGLDNPLPYAQKAETDARRMLRDRSGWADGWAHLLLAGVSNLRGRPDQARPYLERAIEELDRAGLGLHAAAARVRLGALRSDRAGDSMRAQGITQIQEAGVKVPEKFVRMLAPGFAGSGS